MEAKAVVATSILAAGFGIAIVGYGPTRALGESLKTALESMARQPEASPQIQRTLFVDMTLIESIAIYVFVPVRILLFANPLLDYLGK